MPDNRKPSQPAAKESPEEKLENTFSDFEKEILETVEDAAEKEVVSETAKAEQGVSELETEAAQKIARIEAALAQKEKALNAAEAKVFHKPTTNQGPVPRSALQGYRGVAFGGEFSAPKHADHPDPAQQQPHTIAPQTTNLQEFVSPNDHDSVGGTAEVGALAKAPPQKPTADTSALSPAIVQSVGFQNQEIKDYAPTMIATPPDQMIGQAAGLAAQASAQYFDSMSKLVMASQSVMLKKMAEDLSEGNIMTAAEDGLVIAETELLLAAAMAVAAAGGAMEAESANFAIGKINESVQARTQRAAKSIN